MTQPTQTQTHPDPPRAGRDRTPPVPAGAELYVELQMFYAHQMQLLDGDDFAGFAATFTEDALFVPAGRDAVRGREIIARASEAASTRFLGGRPRHWFDMLRAEVAPDGVIRTTYYAMVSVTRADGTNVLEPSCLVRDSLVSRDGRLFNRSRAIERDDLAAAAT
ncbi:nuclear transport factor 2 family protein [Streptomyces lacrimifluminis]|uniref:SnoaL-like domain-containing protein n=1 Tax=Streptomyces lacrimifluminis TaxID=1500077 RepID=A0A917KHW6_9ACTN|nr:nuclear transport factor 2 family protein [Streptomyces lacrimifluminis]GGJ14724.1 hypothetical protein GCM10012282_08770 [Streptomyces lacrimifluminis]